jgi:adenylate cyclase
MPVSTCWSCTPPDVTDNNSAENGPDPQLITDLVGRVEEYLLGGERKYTRIDLAEKSGMDLDETRALWRALGFASAADDDRAFTDADVEALAHVRELSSIAEIGEDVMRAMTRIIGQSFARLASWQGQLVIETVTNSPEMLADGTGERVLELVDNLVPITARLHEYVWRRQLAAYFSRTAGNAGDGAERTQAVGFADMAAFTTFTRRSSEAQLRGVLEKFETVATDVVSDHRGQIVKTIGDEVLFVADKPLVGAEIALALVEAAANDDDLPELRVGLAAGPVVSRLGDVFGQTVNIASRLTSIARPGSILVDEGMHGVLEGADGYALSPLRPVSVRGYHHLRSWRLRRR